MWDRVPFGLQKCRLDDACTCLYLSDAFLRMVGYTRQEIRELFEDSFYRLLPPDDATRVRRSINEALDAGESSLELEYRLQTKDGGYIWVLDRTEVLGEDGTAEACLQDIPAAMFPWQGGNRNGVARTAFSNMGSAVAGAAAPLITSIRALVKRPWRRFVPTAQWKRLHAGLPPASHACPGPSFLPGPH